MFEIWFHLWVNTNNNINKLLENKEKNVKEVS